MSGQNNKSDATGPAKRGGHEPVANVHVSAFEPLACPQEVKDRLPATEDALQTVRQGRAEICSALKGNSEKLVMIVGPCSIHDMAAALDYAGRQAELKKELDDRLIIVMRVYFEKPRTTIGWKGLINDPRVDGSHDINTGLSMARQLLLDINRLGLPCATEFLDPIIPQYIADLISWAAIGARTTESQTHREMASGLSMPVGFKNATDGDTQTAINAMVSSRTPHTFVGIDEKGQTCIVRTSGNPDVHIVLRGGATGPNYSAADIARAKAALGHQPGRLIMVDCSHDNSRKDPAKQPVVMEEVLRQIRGGERAIVGMMLESNLGAGRQDQNGELAYGVSITDPCMDWETTEKMLRKAAK